MSRTRTSSKAAWLRALCLLSTFIIGLDSAAAPTAAGCPLTVLTTDGTTQRNERAPNANFLSGRAVYLITAAELAANGLTSGTVPSAIGWHYSTAPGVTAAGNLIVYLQNTADTTNLKSTTWATAITGMTVVHSSASTTLPDTTAPFDITFTGGSPFTYSGGALYVAFDWQWAGPVGLDAQVATNTVLANGIKGANGGTTPPATLIANSGRPETRLTPSVGTVFNDASVDLVYSLGSLALPLVGPQTVQAVITNRGASALNNLPVTLALTGAETFTDTQNVATLAACGGQTTVTFAPFTPSVIGSDTVTVSVPADDIAGNNSADRPLDETFNLYSYKYPGSTPTNGVGSSGGTIDMVATFTTAVAAKVSAVNLEFPVPTATTYRVAIYPDSGSGTPGLVPLYEDSFNRTVAATGPVTITLPFPIPVGPGSFFAGIQQTNTINAALSYDEEVPIRTGAFFIANPHPATAWIDVAPDYNYKLNIGVTLVQCSNAAECDDTNACTNDACTNQLCVHANISACTDGNSCTDDSCSPATGCVFTNNAASCDDGNPCTTADACGSGACSGTPIAAPLETQNVTVAPDKATYGWFAVAFATWYDVVRGSLSALPIGPGGGDEVCFDNLGGPTVNDATVPAPGTGFFYLSRGENSCGNGTWGTQSNGTPRVTTTCP
jgi:hypothetical protein